MQMQTDHIATLDGKIEKLNSQLDAFLLRYSAQRMFLYACIIIILLVGALLVFVVRAGLRSTCFLDQKPLECRTVPTEKAAGGTT